MQFSKVGLLGGLKIMAALLLVAILVAACSSNPGPNGSQTDPSAPATFQPYDPTSHATPRPHITVQFCDDVTTSYPRDDFNQAKHLLAQWIEQLVTPGQTGAAIYAQPITHNTFTDQTSAIVIQVPPLPSNPVPPTKHVAQPVAEDSNPFDQATATAEVQQHAQDVEKQWQLDNAAYQQALNRQQTLIQNAKSSVQRQLVPLLAWNPLPDNISTDVFGCLQRASDRFQGVGGTKILLLASDWEANGQQQRASLQLQSVSIDGIYFVCLFAQECQTKEAYWQQVVATAHANPIHFYDPAVSETLHNLLLGEQQ